ncbi:oocyte zinc finger protein XlCOF28 [Tribolium castaneum]|uniref:Zinc finger protein 316-like Protein n=1 Tax=Tribolium castaneum TaxID=7070 RepID=D6W8J2_TRICA|nr:PREDICTED: oocyte zinc finger protein XlCOF28 [Tribolium castaneum]XP_015840609.1 PREDICTED: oocyte zinc finger protein XlCOF28 [Tribolium castaneum]EEZ98365.1 Zinc finger protein 316-like Protein [Tribolium castaneum]|eukprot:XP_008201352.1 PREDICTED: oocyte zinc finger protein XlCOF28 [Tribolium castaneum]
MEYESESTICGICGNYDKLLTLNAREQLLVREVFRCIFLHPNNSTKACDFCIHKLYNFKNFLKQIILNQAKLRKTHETTMQQDPNKDDADEPHTDKYNCRCSNCQNKFGSLPLLVQVIEENEKTEPMPSTSRDLSPKPSRKTMKCTHCEKTFSHKGDLNKHVRTHTGEQPFTCSVCDRKFAHTSNLARHLRLHSGDRPFTCENCNKHFSRKDKLDLHRRSKNCKKTS